MKRKKYLLITIAAVLTCSGILVAADHIDSPAVTNQPSDITDLYVFRGENPDNLVFVANTQGLLSPSSTSSAKFDERTMIEFNVDNNGDNVEDLVIQCIAKNGMMKVYGPFKPPVTGTISYLGVNDFTGQVEITPYGQPPIIAQQKGVKLFAGPRDDPFFFDLARFREIIAGTATAFNNPGNDTFAGTNVLGLVVEVPKKMLGGNGTINVWAETKRENDNK
jgi:uncharacterized protein DUF4331